MPAPLTQRFTHDGQDFELEPCAADSAWRLHLLAGTPDKPSRRVVGNGLFAQADPAQALQRAQALVHEIFPVGVRLIGPDVAHPVRIGDVLIVGPNVAHPNFVRWSVPPDGQTR